MVNRHSYRDLQFAHHLAEDGVHEILHDDDAHSTKGRSVEKALRSPEAERSEALGNERGNDGFV